MTDDRMALMEALQKAHVKQKNGAVVRRMVGYRRYTGIAAAMPVYLR